MNIIKTYAILNYGFDKKEHRQKFFDEKSEKLKKYLKDGNFPWFPIRQNHDNTRCSIIIYNISRDQAVCLALSYVQRSLIWCNVETGEKDYFENAYCMDCMFTTYKIRPNENYERQAEERAIYYVNTKLDELDAILKTHKEILEKAVARNLERYNEDYSYAERKLHQMLSDGTSGRAQWEARGSLFCGYKRFIQK